MKRYLIVFAGAILFLAGLGLAPIVSQDMGNDACAGDECGEPEGEADSEADAWTKAQAPGKAHEVLEKMAGDWDMAMSLWMQPGADPLEINTETEMEMELGGRFLTGEYEMKGGPFPHKGETWYGYDNSKKKYNYLRLTDMDTAMRVYEGDYDKDKKQLTLRANYKMSWDGQEVSVRERNVYTFESDDKFTLEVWTYYEGFPNMPEEGVREVRIVYTRKEG